MDAIGFIALLLLAVPIVLVAVLGVVLAVASRHSRVAGLAILMIVGVLLAGLALLMWVRVGYDAHYAGAYDEVSAVAPPIETSEWISVEDKIVPVAVTAEAATLESETAEAESEPDSRSPAEAISRALVRAVGDSPPLTDDPSGDTEDDAIAAPVDFAVESAESEDVADAAVSAPVATDSTEVAADYRPTDADRAEVAEIKRYLDEAESSAGITSDVDVLGPGATLTLDPPPWVNRAAFDIDGIVYRPVASGPYATRDECRRALAEAMKRAVDEYVDEYHGSSEAADYVDIGLAYIKTHLRRGDVYQERVQASFGPMIQQHALLEFRQEFREEIERRWNEVRVTSRLGQVSLAAAAILAGLATIFIYLRLDTATKGYYSGRLQIAAVAVILGLVALGILTARWIPWL